MAARALLVSSPATMALLVLVLLCYFPDSAPASFLDHPLGDLLGKAGTANATAPAASASNGTASNSSKMAAPAPSAQKKEEDQAAKQEREKQRQQLKELEAEGREYAKEHGLVSKTNFTGTYKGMAREFVSIQNAVRARYGLAPMKWDNTVARHARRWANAVRKDCQLKHSGNKNYGESIFLDPDYFNATAKDAVKMWSDEEHLYDNATGKCIVGYEFKDCGHFALMVRKRYTKMGCARSECFKGGVFMTCNYH